MTLELLFTVAISALLLCAGGFALWLLPWSDAEVARTTRAFRGLPSMAGRMAGRVRIQPVRIPRARAA
jgi:hypothetical protein